MTGKQCATGGHDPLRNTRTNKPVALHNKYQLLHNDDEDEPECDDNTDNENDVLLIEQTQTANEQPTRHKPNKRQRQRRKAMTLMAIAQKQEDEPFQNGKCGNDHKQHEYDNHDDHTHNHNDSECIIEHHGWHPGFEHSGCLSSMRRQLATHGTMHSAATTLGKPTPPWRKLEQSQQADMHVDAQQHARTTTNTTITIGCDDDHWFKPSITVGKWNCAEFIPPEVSESLVRQQALSNHHNAHAAHPAHIACPRLVYRLIWFHV